ncbi:class F sortase [Streptomyces peucetius]|uniref:Class F sortase n=1 Tax=Streptomyces peucetius TaxID=1950 RepID=A0ABY6I5U0_STRPE|nr:class F sortase [Streptomyces peucetius]UYQ62356.1 class F sortase [Streptomyces peucetius]
MSRPRHRTARPARALTAAVCLVLAAVAGCSAPQRTAAPDPAPPASTASAPAPASPDRRRTAAEPVQVAIPSIGVRSALMRLGLQPDGTVEVPPAEKGMTAGWYTGAAVPGELGAAVIIGHNETRFGRAVFHDLRDIRRGADITVRDAAGTAHRFTVTATETVSKKAFPTERVYGATDDRVLRLITCDGAFDDEGHPVDNLIVHAALRP